MMDSSGSIFNNATAEQECGEFVMAEELTVRGCVPRHARMSALKLFVWWALSQQTLL
jgi:hypothetical protein